MFFFNFVLGHFWNIFFFNTFKDTVPALISGGLVLKVYLPLILNYETPNFKGASFIHTYTCRTSCYDMLSKSLVLWTHMGQNLQDGKKVL